MKRTGWMCAMTAALLASFHCANSFANGVLLDGVDARSMALGGASVASPDRPSEAMNSNPGGLGFVDAPSLELGGVVGFIQGSFTDSVNSGAHAAEYLGGCPMVAFAYPLKDTPFSFGASIMPDSLANADWHFVDKPGGMDGATTYGDQRQFAQFLAIRGAAGASWKINETLSLGADLGVEYNRDRLVSPYVFQTFTPLQGFKTLLDLRTEGWGMNGSAGLVWRPTEKVSIGASYRSMTYMNTTGYATGNAGAQLQNIGAGSFQPNFNYGAQVMTKLPQTVLAGVSWQVQDWMCVIVEADWIQWSAAFDNLNIRLHNGNNSDINNFLGVDHMQDNVPLHWQDSFVYRAGLEFPFAADYTARAGYSYGANPNPSATYTPMSGPIFEHMVSCGLEWHHGRWTAAAAYQYFLPSTSDVTTSSLQAGEFSNSSTTVAAHMFGVTIGSKF